MKKSIQSIVCAWIVSISAFAQIQTQLIIPDTLVGPNYTLNLHKDSVQFFPTGNKSETYAYNNNKYFGPTLIFKKGENVNISVINQINQTTTVHWHGIHLPSKWDGGPHTPILQNASWNPQFKVMDNAATYWYHPHMHMQTTEQTIKGAIGLIIVRDPIEAALILPRKYGTDDFPLIIQSLEFDEANQIYPWGMHDSTLLINGARANYGNKVYANFPAQVVRMRILNASGGRTFNFGFTANKSFKMIASDGGLLNVPVNLTRLHLASGERAEILLDLNGMNGQTIHLMSYASELTMGIQGGPTMSMPGMPPMRNPLNGIDFNIMQINIVPQTVSPVTIVPTVLTTNTSYPVGSANITRTIRITADNLMEMYGPFYFNDSTFNMMRIDYEIPINNIEIWKLVNKTMIAHPFHIHDVQFYLIDRNGNLPAPEERGRKDVVLVPPGDSVMFITKFEDYSDNDVPYMFHCHILTHEDMGMMGQFIVKANSTGIDEMKLNNAIVNIYPNPAASSINIELESGGGSFEIKVYDLLGNIVYAEKKHESKCIINSSNWNNGLYTISIQQNKNSIREKIIINK